MAEKDSLGAFDFNTVTKQGKFLKFVAGEPVTIRILTKDPVVSETEFKEGSDGSISLSTRFSFIVWNFTAEKAQILTAPAGMAKTFQKIGKDDDFGANIQHCDLKISPEGEKLNRVYDINVLRHSGSEKSLTKDQLQECVNIDLDKEVQDNKGRLSEWEGPSVTEESGLEKARQTAREINDRAVTSENGPDPEEEPLDLSEIPF